MKASKITAAQNFVLRPDDGTPIAEVYRKAGSVRDILSLPQEATVKTISTTMDDRRRSCQL